MDTGNLVHETDNLFYHVPSHLLHLGLPVSLPIVGKPACQLLGGDASIFHNLGFLQFY